MDQAGRGDDALARRQQPADVGHVGTIIM